VVQPATVIRWHREGFRLYWRWRSRASRCGRPRTDAEIRNLIREMARANPLCGAPRLHGELLKLGLDVSQRTVSRVIGRQRKPPSQAWRAFLDNHLKELASLDFFVVPTASFRVLYVLVVLRHDRRRIAHVNVTSKPTAEWTAQQVVEAFPWDEAPRFLMRDRDAIFGDAFRRRVRGLRIEEVISAPRSPWQNPLAERVIGTLRRELTDHVIGLDERHLLRMLREYVAYYHASRTHLSLAKDAPLGREVQGPWLGNVVAIPQVGGLHHRYERRAA
jgi:transposase InsO family protein